MSKANPQQQDILLVDRRCFLCHEWNKEKEGLDYCDCCMQNRFMFALPHVVPVSLRWIHIILPHTQRRENPLKKVMSWEMTEGERKWVISLSLSLSVSLSRMLLFSFHCMVCIAYEMKSQQLCVYWWPFLSPVPPHFVQSRATSFQNKSFWGILHHCNKSQQ